MTPIISLNDIRDDLQQHAPTSVMLDEPISDSNRKEKRQERFLALLDPVYCRLEGFAFAMERDRDRALDLVGETVLRAYENFDALSDDAAFLSWLLTTAHRIGNRRRWRRRIFGEYDEHYAATLRSDTGDPDLATDVSGAGQKVTSANSCRPDFIIWFDHTPELVRLLPSNWQDRLTPLANGSQQKQSITRRAPSGERGVTSAHSTKGAKRSAPAGNGAPAAIPAEPPSESAIDHDDSPGRLTQNETHQQLGSSGIATGGPVMTAGAIDSVELQPNPVSGVGALRLLLKQERTVAVSLHTVQGDRIALLAADRKIAGGSAEIVLSFVGVPPGFYLLVVATDQGERVARRVMVRE